MTKQTNSEKPKRDLYQEVTDKILKLLDQGVPPWRQPITSADGPGLPTSFGTKKPYRGINLFLLAITSWAHDYASNYWLTFNQAKQLGGKVRKGEKGSPVLFWKQHATKDRESGEDVTIPVLRHYVVFNADQVEGLPKAETPSAEPREFVPLEAAARIVKEYRDPPVIELRGNRACYLPREDRVEIADPLRFESTESFFATLFHELAHSTGHPKRLARDLGDTPSVFGSPDYGNEELVAEMGSAFLCAAAGISPPTIEQSAAYLEGWRKSLRADKKLVIAAAGQGQRAADHILGVTFDS
ncbi:ArdC family protein [Botrimarina mediterranea]|uniref:DNA primase TraC n=1 Tax=Botrimarina mediterranea TaxID=2528022 RepID=A0A518K248_9BACT|nr:ArdC-like ssDNA-binding domain-containing protein [Botrimarina mediterranea]QDV71883.1 DNA primase TraC [Botrimarina mediterranea]